MLDIARPLGAKAERVATTAEVIDAYTAGELPPELARLVELIFIRASLAAYTATASHTPVSDAITAPDLRETWERMLP